jgi:arginyl-tRNA synthetase
MTLSQTRHQSKKAIQDLFDIAIDKIEFQSTRKEFEIDITMVIFLY